MTKGKSELNPEAQRLMGWFTENCSPNYWKEGTMIFNITARNFLHQIVGKYIFSFYENCTILTSDFDGYGWSESTRVVDDFFKYDKCFVIMTASQNNIKLGKYHTFVIDGIAEFQKRMQGSGFLGTGLFKKWRDGVLHLYHVNPGWNGDINGYFLYVQNVNDEFDFIRNNRMDYDSNVSYLIVRPR